MRYLVLTSALSVVALCAAGSAYAQSVDTPAPPSGAASSETQDAEARQGIGDIVVVAQRRSENLQRVPIAISALPEERLEAANITSTAQLTNVTPAITLNATVGFLLPRIRGIGNSAAGPAVENSVATYVDGVYIASAPGTLLDLNNVARVEVLKGPQGTLFGRNATGGLIQVITKDPSSTFHGEANVGYGNYNTAVGDAYLTGPITTGLSADLSVSGRYQGDGWGKNLFTGTDVYRVHGSFSARSKWLLSVDEATKLRLSFDVMREVSSIPSPGLLGGTAAAAYVDAAGKPIVINTKPRDLFTNDDPLHKTLSWGASAKFDHDFGGVTLTDIAAYRQMRLDQAFDADGSPTPLYYQTYAQHDAQFSEEFQLASSSHGPFQWIIGAYYFDLTSDWNPLRTAIGPNASRGASVNRVFLTTRSVSGYAQATYSITTDTRLTGGFRYTTETGTLEGNTTAVAASGAATTSALPTGSFDSNTPTWRVALDHDFAPAVMGYLSWNRGFKSGGFNGQAPTQAPYQPETLDAYEAGLKSTLFDRRLRVNIAAFLYNYRNVQVNTFQGAIGVIYNGAKARIYGIDADVDVAITDRLSLTGGAVALHDRFVDFPLAQIARPNGNGTVAIVPGPATGNRLPFASDFNGTLGFVYRARLTDNLATDFAISNLYSTGFFTQPDNYLKQNSYVNTNASVNVKVADNRFNVKLWVSNLFDKNVLTIASASSSFQFASYAAPRTFGISLGTRF